MRLQNIPQNGDIGYTDTLTPGVGRAIGGRLNGDCFCSMTGSSLQVTISAGVIWMQDVSGTYTGIANSLIRQVQTGSTTVTLASNPGGAAGPRVDIVVARLGTSGWGGAPTFAVVAGTATASADARNLKGAAALTAGDVPLVAVAVPVGANPSAFGARVSNGTAEDARRFAVDATMPGTQKHHGGFGPNGSGGWAGGQGGSASSPLPPVGYKFEDGGIYGTVTNGPWNDLVTELGQTWGATSGSAAVPDTRGRVRVGSGQGGGLTSRTLGASVGTEGHSHVLSSNGKAVAHNHPLSGSGYALSHNHDLDGNGRAQDHNHVQANHFHGLGSAGGVQLSVGNVVYYGAFCSGSYSTSGNESWSGPSSGGGKGALTGHALYGITNFDGGGNTTFGSGTLGLSGITRQPSLGQSYSDGSGNVYLGGQTDNSSQTNLTGNTDAAAQGSMQPSAVSGAIIKF